MQIPGHLRSLKPGMAEALGHYVYLYIDPRDEKVFYIGKGKGERCLDHLFEDDDHPKVQRIRDIFAAGLEPRIEILRHGMASKEEAYLVEAVAMDIFGQNDLTNIAIGHGSSFYGRATLADLTSRYQPEEAEIRHKVVFLKLAQTYRKTMSPQELYEAARGVWNFSAETASKYDYAICVYEGLVVEVFRTHYWQKSDPAHYPTRNDLEAEHFENTSEFVGEVAEQAVREHYIGKSVRSQFAAGGLVFNKYGPDLS
jgi:hypothetical protein